MNRSPIEKNEELELAIDSVTLEGAGVGRVDGFAVFVPGALAGERVRTHIIKTTASYAVGKLLEVAEPSPHRMEPLCPVYARCGGCAFGHVTYEEELRIKERQVADALTRLGGLKEVPMRPILGMDLPQRYRNKGAFPYGMTEAGPAFGFYAPRSHRLAPVDDCLIEQEGICRAVGVVKAWAERYQIRPYDEKTGKGTLRHAVVRVTTDRELMAVIVTKGDLPHKKELTEALSFADSVYWNRNERTTNVIFGAMPNPIHSTSSGAIAIVGIVCVMTRIGDRAWSSHRKRSMTVAITKASPIPIRRPYAASCREVFAWYIRFGKSPINARITSTGDGSM